MRKEQAEELAKKIQQFANITVLIEHSPLMNTEDDYDLLVLTNPKAVDLVKTIANYEGLKTDDENRTFKLITIYSGNK